MGLTLQTHRHPLRPIYALSSALIHQHSTVASDHAVCAMAVCESPMKPLQKRPQMDFLRLPVASGSGSVTALPLPYKRFSSYRFELEPNGIAICLAHYVLTCARFLGFSHSIKY